MMLTCELERLALQYEQDFQEIMIVLQATVPYGLITRWELPNRNQMVLVHKSTKTSGTQLTSFTDGIPTYDLQRTELNDLAHELVLLDAKIHTINYIF